MDFNTRRERPETIIDNPLERVVFWNRIIPFLNKKASLNAAYVSSTTYDTQLNYTQPNLTALWAKRVNNSTEILALQPEALYMFKPKINKNLTRLLPYLKNCLIVDLRDSRLITIEDNFCSREWNSLVKIIYLPLTLKDIGNNFANIPNLVSVFIPSSVISIGDGFAFNSHKLSSLDIPDSVLSIGNLFACSCHNIISLNIPNSISNIEDDFACDCRNLTTLNISNSVKNIGNSFASECGNLTSFDIPYSVVNIGNDFLADCKNLLNVNISSSVVCIGDRFVYGCINIITLNIPDSVRRIGSAFAVKCQRLRNIYLPDNLEYIGEYFARSTSPDLRIYVKKDSKTDAILKKMKIQTYIQY
jgi:hypothetical protein